MFLGGLEVAGGALEVVRVTVGVSRTCKEVRQLVFLELARWFGGCR